MKKTLFTLVCMTSCLCGGSLFASKTPGEKIDKAIEKTKEKAEDAKDAVKEKAEEAKDVVKEKWEDAKDVAKKESDKVREEISDKVKPGR